MSSRLDRYVELWQLTAEGEPFHTATSTLQYVRKDDQHCVLKVGRSITDEATAAALRHYDGRGAVRLVAHDGAATLMHRASPGTPLSDLVRDGADDEATRIVCTTMSALHTGIPAALSFPRVEDWAAAFERPAAAKVPRALIAEASAIYADLCRTQTRRVLLHGDLHHDNILFDAGSGWLAIDPKGVIGEPAFEAGAALRNPGDDPRLFASADIIERRVRIMCDMQGWHRDRVVRWCFAQGVLSAVWSIEDGEDPARGFAIATAAREWI